MSAAGPRVQEAVDVYVADGKDEPVVFLRSLRPRAVADAYAWACTDDAGLRSSDPVLREAAVRRLEDDAIGFSASEVAAARKRIQLPDSYFTWRVDRSDADRQLRIMELS